METPRDQLLAFVLLAVLALPAVIAGWLWRAEKIPGRAVATLVVGRFPIACFVIVLIATGSLPFALLVGALGLPTVLLHGPISTFLGDGPAPGT